MEDPAGSEDLRHVPTISEGSEKNRIHEYINDCERHPSLFSRMLEKCNLNFFRFHLTSTQYNVVSST